MISTTPDPVEPARGRRARRHRLAPALLAVLLVAGLGSTSPVAAELVVFADGDFLSVAGYRIDGGEVHLELRSGGTMVLPLVRIQRIVEDEIDDSALGDDTEALEEMAVTFTVRFDEALHTAPKVPFGDLIWSAARRHGINPELIAAVARAESAYRPRAVSPKGAQGLMQLMPATARRFGVHGDEVYEPGRNLDAGSRYLRWLADRFGDRLELILAGYNAGEGTVDRYNGVPPYRETRTYIRRIFSTLGLDHEAALGGGGEAHASRGAASSGFSSGR